ncbi:MAG: hypothetical protein RI983_1110 [Bacteroidota bacterium]|jgi:hypothetical protein
MERVGTLINKLQEQFNRKEAVDKLAITAQLLLAELQMQKPACNTSSKVAVVMPSIAITKPDVEKEAVLPSDSSNSAAAKEEKLALTHSLFESYADIPTLIHQPVPPSVPKEELQVKEVNELLINDIPELNEQLKEYTVEVASLLDETPVRDLKKAISINDRYLFINHLFRGDENMYERSIKTINGFNIFPEAQYWIQRELKVKLGWLEDNPSVKLFDQLVKRRFS